DPRALSTEEQLGRGLGLRPRRAVRTPLFATAVFALAAACLLIFIRPFPDGGFIARGPRLTSDIIVYRVRKQQAPERLPPTARIAPDDELPFSYVTPEGYPHLAIFAVDEQHHVYWYHPAWTDGAADPPAIAISPGARPVQLAEAVRHAFVGRSLTLYAL